MILIKLFFGSLLPLIIIIIAIIKICATKD